MMLTLGGLPAGREKPADIVHAAQGEAEPNHVSEKNGEVGVTLDSETALRIQLKTEQLRTLSRTEETDLPAAIVTDPEATSLVRAGVAGRLATIDGTRWPRFGFRLEAGDSVAVIGDARPVTVPRNGTVSRVLVQPGELVQPGQELFEVTSYDAPLVQVAWSSARSDPPTTMEFSAGADHARVRGVLTGPAPQADPVTRDPAWLYRVAGGWKGMRPGASVTAHVSDGKGVRHGVLVPSAAVVQWDALAWAYEEREAGRYVRVRVPTDHPVPGGWLVTASFQPGDRVVTSGAGQLLSEEFRARIVVGEEVGE
jgi:biotin carboxyl carrier protein